MGLSATPTEALEGSFGRDGPRPLPVKNGEGSP